MGLEAVCGVRFGKHFSQGKAHLDSDQLLFRGDFRLAIPFKNMKSVTADDRCLTIALEDGAAQFELGAASAKWAVKILNPPQRLDKLGVKSGMKVLILGVKDTGFHEEVKGREASIFTRPRKDADLVFFGAAKKADLQGLHSLPACLKPAGAIWVIYPKGVKDITQAEVMAASKNACLVDVKVASFSPTHTALKLMIPVSKRMKSPKP
jgi:hypothetical protein